MEPMEPTEPTAAEQLANAQAAVAEAKIMVEEALTAASSNSDRAAAYSSLAAAQAALAEASGIPENEIALLTGGNCATSGGHQPGRRWMPRPRPTAWRTR